MSRLPRVNNGFGNNNETVREYLQKKRDANKIPKELEDYLCEREIYTPENYDIIRSKFSQYIEDHTSEINSACCTHNTSAFESFFQNALRLTNDWTSARMVVHCCLQTFSMGGMTTVFEWADDLMIKNLYSSRSINR
tara:strand:+ start:4951 stop:5361 length:411 start_codon:yes stop_codon:yes gene_type:complete